nr:Glycosyl transferase [uncultured bacterium]
MAEDVTLAQVVRLYVLARSLDPERYEVHFACARFDPLIFEGAAFARHPIFTIDRKVVFRKLRSGSRLYDASILARYVRDELELFRELRPDVVIGDFRMSLCVSAESFGVPYASLINAYWSRHMERATFPLPDHPIVSLLGERLSAQYFPKALPTVFSHFAKPVNELRKRYGLEPVGDLIDVLLAGDLTLFPDVPWLTPLRGRPDSQVFLGPVLWSPELELPAWWDEAAARPRTAYVTLGSSGRVDCLPVALEGLEQIGVTAMVATAGRCAPPKPGASVFTAEYLPGTEAARASQVVVCNGGSSTAYQALAEGCPVLGIASNLDQYLAMSAIQERGAGILLRGSTVTREQVAQAATTLLEEPSYRARARVAQEELCAYDSRARFRTALSLL